MKAAKNSSKSNRKSGAKQKPPFATAAALQLLLPLTFPSAAHLANDESALFADAKEKKSGVLAAPGGGQMGIDPQGAKADDAPPSAAVPKKGIKSKSRSLFNFKGKSTLQSGVAPISKTSPSNGLSPASGNSSPGGAPPPQPSLTEADAERAQKLVSEDSKSHGSRSHSPLSAEGKVHSRHAPPKDIWEDSSLHLASLFDKPPKIDNTFVLECIAKGKYEAALLSLEEFENALRSQVSADAVWNKVCRVFSNKTDAQTEAEQRKIDLAARLAAFVLEPLDYVDLKATFVKWREQPSAPIALRFIDLVERHLNQLRDSGILIERNDLFIRDNAERSVVTFLIEQEDFDHACLPLVELFELKRSVDPIKILADIEFNKNADLLHAEKLLASILKSHSAKNRKYFWKFYKKSKVPAVREIGKSLMKQFKTASPFMGPHPQTIRDVVHECVVFEDFKGADERLEEYERDLRRAVSPEDVKAAVCHALLNVTEKSTAKKRKKVDFAARIAAFTLQPLRDKYATVKDWNRTNAPVMPLFAKLVEEYLHQLQKSGVIIQEEDLPVNRAIGIHDMRQCLEEGKFEHAYVPVRRLFETKRDDLDPSLVMAHVVYKKPKILIHVEKLLAINLKTRSESERNKMLQPYKDCPNQPVQRMIMSLIERFNPTAPKDPSLFFSIPPATPSFANLPPQKLQEFVLERIKKEDFKTAYECVEYVNSELRRHIEWGHIVDSLARKFHSGPVVPVDNSMSLDVSVAMATSSEQTELYYAAFLMVYALNHFTSKLQDNATDKWTMANHNLPIIWNFNNLVNRCLQYQLDRNAPFIPNKEFSTNNSMRNHRIGERISVGSYEAAYPLLGALLKLQRDLDPKMILSYIEHKKGDDLFFLGKLLTFSLEFRSFHERNAILQPYKQCADPEVREVITSVVEHFTPFALIPKTHVSALYKSVDTHLKAKRYQSAYAEVKPYIDLQQQTSVYSIAEGIEKARQDFQGDKDWDKCAAILMAFAMEFYSKEKQDETRKNLFIHWEKGEALKLKLTEIFDLAATIRSNPLQQYSVTQLLRFAIPHATVADVPRLIAEGRFKEACGLLAGRYELRRLPENAITERLQGKSVDPADLDCVKKLLKFYLSLHSGQVKEILNRWKRNCDMQPAVQEVVVKLLEKANKLECEASKFSAANENKIHHAILEDLKKGWPEYAEELLGKYCRWRETIDLQTIVDCLGRKGMDDPKELECAAVLAIFATEWRDKEDRNEILGSLDTEKIGVKKLVEKIPFLWNLPNRNAALAEIAMEHTNGAEVDDLSRFIDCGDLKGGCGALAGFYAMMRDLRMDEIFDLLQEKKTKYTKKKLRLIKTLLELFLNRYSEELRIANLERCKNQMQPPAVLDVIEELIHSYKEKVAKK